MAFQQVVRLVAFPLAAALVVNILVVWPALAAPTNDNFANAAIIGLPNATTSNTAGATVESGEMTTLTDCVTSTGALVSAPIGATVWYRVSPSQDGILSVSTVSDGTDYDTVLGVYTGPPDSSLSQLTLLGCNDDRGGSRQSGVSVNVQVVEPYWIQVGGYSGATGNVNLNITFVGGTRSCGGGFNYFSVVCDYGSPTSASFSAGQAAWPSVGLNITQAGATAGSWIQQALWFNNNFDQLPPNHTWLEIGDSAGTARMENYEYQWQRWHAWVQGFTSGAYHEWGIQLAPNDGVTRNFIIQWDSAEGSWGLYICDSAGCERKAFTTWVPPSEMRYQMVSAGLEVNPHVMNSNTNTNSQTFTDSTLLYRDLANNWFPWQMTAQVDAGCDIRPTGFCLNGVASGSTWLNNKP